MTDTCTLPVATHGEKGPLVVMLHWLSGSSRTWTEVSERLAARGLRCAALDLPGFGEAAALPGSTVQAMADAVIETVRGLRGRASTPWLLAGHSMGCKVAAVVARAASDGVTGLQGLSGMLLVSASPPGPEPMPEGDRARMLASIGRRTGDAADDRKHAEGFIDDNTGLLPLAPAVRERAVNDVLRANRAAITAWFEGGSKEDWRDRVGVLPVPAIILAGNEETALGLAVQREHSARHYASVELVELKGVKHEAPLEQPAEVAERMAEFVMALGLKLEPAEAALSPGFAALIDSSLTSPQTRELMQQRLAPGEPHELQTFSREEYRTLRALVECAISDAGFDLAARLDAALHTSSGDGWRFDTLPPDAEAWRKGLHSLTSAADREHHVSFVALGPDERYALLQRAVDGHLGRSMLARIGLGEATDDYTGPQMKQWFEDVRSVLTQLWAADPRSMERMGFTGFADEGGFTQIRLGEQERFEV